MKCCVPGCEVQAPLHCLPFTSGWRWVQWLTFCPFLRTVSLRKLENMKICRQHFIPQHIDREKGRLTKDAIPLSNLPHPWVGGKKIYKRTKVLEISPIEGDGAVNVKIVSHNNKLYEKRMQRFRNLGKQQVINQMCLVKSGLPADHNRYCLPYPKDDRFVRHSPSHKKLKAREQTMVSNKTGQSSKVGLPVDHNMYCAKPQPDDTFKCLSIKNDNVTKPLCNLKTQPNNRNTVDLGASNISPLKKEAVVNSAVKLTSSDQTIVSMNTKSKFDDLVDPNKYCATSQADDNFECLSIKNNIVTKPLCNLKTQPNNSNTVNIGAHKISLSKKEAFSGAVKLSSSNQTIVSVNTKSKCDDLVDPNMYCATSQPDDNFECLSIKNDIVTKPLCNLKTQPNNSNTVNIGAHKISLLKKKGFSGAVKFSSSDQTIVSVNTKSKCDDLVDPNMCSATSQPDDTLVYVSSKHLQQIKPVNHNIDTQYLTPMKEERNTGTALGKTVSVASQTNVVEPNAPTEVNEQLPDFMSEDIDHSLGEDYRAETVKCLQNSHFIILNDSDVQGNLYLVPTNLVTPESLQTDSQESSFHLIPNDLDLLPSKSPLEKETLESVHSLFSALKNQHNLPLNNVPPVTTNTVTFTQENHSSVLNKPAEWSNQRSVMDTNVNLLQPLQQKPLEHTLESLVAELKESVMAEEMYELEPSTDELPTETSHPTSVAAPCPPVQNLSFPRLLNLKIQNLHPLASRIYIRKVASSKNFQDKKNNENEKMKNETKLRMQIKKLRNKLKLANKRFKNLKSKWDNIQTIAKPFLKGYPHLTIEGKALISTQLRIAGKCPKAARYSEEEKLFALKLYQLSPKTYKFLQKYLKLPTKTTILQKKPEAEDILRAS